MDYNLAKELKEAGFKNVRLCEREDEHMMKDCGECDMARYPTLEELIEACGDKFRALERRTSNLPEWAEFVFQVHGFKDNGIGYVTEVGETPKIAFAKFWLAINKK